MADPSLLIGRAVSHYRILDRLGAGGMGVVYKAEDTRLHRLVALKFLPEGSAGDPTALERFRREAKAASALNHPNICTIHDIGEHEGRPFLVMEHLEGESLQHRLSAGPFSLEELLELGIDVAAALEAAHGQGIVHRDIKPANLFLTRLGSAKVLDFGLAKRIVERAPSEDALDPTRTHDEADLTRTGAAIGTAPYMSPEQVLGEPLDARTDLFSLGAVLYEAATGQPAFTGANGMIVFDAILHRAPVPPLRLRPELPKELERILITLLEKDRSARYQRASDLLADLERLRQNSRSGGRAAPADAASVPRGSFPVRRTAIAAAVAIAILGAVLALWLHRLRAVRALTEKDTIVLADFTNTTGDPVFDGALRQGLAVQLEQSPFLSLVSDERIQHVLHLMGRSADARLTPQVAQEICERTGSAAVLEGSIASLGSQYVLGLRATTCGTGDILDEEQAQVPRKEDVLGALGRIASRFRARVGESLATVQRYDTPLAEATTGSLDALKAYSAGLAALRAGGSASALPFFERAVEIDPIFAMAHAWLGRVYGDVGESARSAASTRRAYELRERASDAERFFIVASYEMQVTGNLERAQQVLESWIRTYPREPNSHALLGGLVYPCFGEFEKAVAEETQAIELDPDFALPYSALGYAYLGEGRFDEASRALDRAAARKLTIPDFVVLSYLIAFLKGDRAEMERQVALAKGNVGLEDWMANQQAFALAYVGRRREAAKMSAEAVELARQAGQRERAALYLAGEAVGDGFLGAVADAKQGAAAALALSRGRDVEYGAAVALALAGDVPGAQALADDLEKRFPEGTSVRLSYLPVLRAMNALKRGDLSGALRELEAAAPYEIGSPVSSLFAIFGSLYPVYVRGETYLAAHRGEEAAAEFRKILDHRGVVMNDPVGALARLGLARAYAVAGDAGRARAAYRDFLDLWRDADPDLVPLEAARAESEKLE